MRINVLLILIFSLFTLEGSEKYSFQNSLVKKLEYQNGSGDLEIKKGSGKEIEVEVNKEIWDQYCELSLKIEKEVLVSAVEDKGGGGKITRKGCHAHFKFYLPSGIDMSLKSGSGDVLVESGGEEKLQINVGSGDIELLGVHKKVKVQTGSGEIECEKFSAEKIDFVTGSGDIECKMETSDKERKMTVQTGSGDVIFSGLSRDSVEVKSGSGDAHLTYQEKAEGKISIKIGSGETQITLPSTATLSSSYKGHAGKFISDFPDSGKNGKLSIQVSTGAGDFIIKKAEK